MQCCVLLWNIVECCALMCITVQRGALLQTTVLFVVVLCCVVIRFVFECSAHLAHREEVGETALLLCKVNNLGKLVEEQRYVKCIQN